MDQRFLGLMPYAEAWHLQQELLRARICNEIEDTLLIVEHPAVITMGRKFAPAQEFPKAMPNTWQGLPFFMVERGGEATYHGPGQIIIYPILRLPVTSGPRAFLRLLEAAMIQLLEKFGIIGYRREGITGVWVHDADGRACKIASLGIAVRHSVTYHGLALNYATDLSHFYKIQPCGLSPSVMINLKDLVPEGLPEQSKIAQSLAGIIIDLFQVEKNRGMETAYDLSP